MNESKPRARYTLEFNLEAVKLVKGGQVAAVTSKILGIRQAGEPRAVGVGQAAR